LLPVVFYRSAIWRKTGARKAMRFNLTGIHIKFVLGLLMVALLTAHTAAQVSVPKIAAPSAGFPAPTTKPPMPLPVEEAVLKAAD